MPEPSNMKGDWFVQHFDDALATTEPPRPALRPVLQQNLTEGAQVWPPTCPSVFVAVLSRRSSFGHRSVVREMWTDAHKDWSGLRANFAVCNGRPEEDAALEVKLKDEAKQFQDIVFLDCNETTDGMFSPKMTSSAMEHYLKERVKAFDFFMSVEDDTFVSPRRLCTLMENPGTKTNGKINAYMGVFMDLASPQEWAHNFMETQAFPAAKPASGFILPAATVSHIISLRIHELGLSSQYTKAVGSWLNEIRKVGFGLRWINVPGTDGRPVENQNGHLRKGPYWAYPAVLHHNLTDKAISCLHKIDTSGSDGSWIDPCFP